MVISGTFIHRHNKKWAFMLVPCNDTTTQYNEYKRRKISMFFWLCTAIRNIIEEMFHHRQNHSSTYLNGNASKSPDDDKNHIIKIQNTFFSFISHNKFCFAAFLALLYSIRSLCSNVYAPCIRSSQNYQS